ncbi:MAG: ABC transporter permease [Chloroflexi bacterium]|nr:ABC transporter permease [Chloroflexota bacterium]
MAVTANGIPKVIEKEAKKRAFLVDVFVRLVKEKPLGTIGGVIVLVFFLIGILANFIAPYGYNDINPAFRLSGPSAQYLLGADNLGRDLLSRVIYGARISMIVGLSVSFLSVTIASLIGVTSGYFGGKFDLIVQRFVDAWMCFPGLFIILTIIAILGPGMIQVIVVMGFMFGVASSRVVRSAVIGIKENVYLEAARAIGAQNRRILTHHVLPNIAAPILVIFTIQMGASIITEATMSFLGFGIPPPTPSWGGMLSGSGRQYMLQAPWLAFWPGLALAIVVWGINMLGDGLRDVLDPRLRGGLGRYVGTKKKIAKLTKQS